MAKRSPVAGTTDENVVAAHQFIIRNSDEFARHADVLLHRSQGLASQVAELQMELAGEQEAHKEAVRKAEARYDRDVAELKAKLTATEDKMRRIVGAING